MGIPAPIVALMQQMPSDSNGDNNYAQRLYDIHDELCFGISAFENGRHLTRDWRSLRSGVDLWQNQRELNWKPEEIDEVTAYLNMRFFHYPISV